MEVTSNTESGSLFRKSSDQEAICMMYMYFELPSCICIFPFVYFPAPMGSRRMPHLQENEDSGSAAYFRNHLLMDEYALA